MVTPCPSCKKSIEHEDFLFEVRCLNCNTRFNPFMTVHEGAHEEEAPAAVAPPPIEAPPPTALETEEAPAEMPVAPADLADSLGAPAGGFETPVDPMGFGESLGAPAQAEEVASLDAFTLGEPSAPPAAEPMGNAFGGGELGGSIEQLLGEPAGGVEPTPTYSPPPASGGSAGQFGESNAFLQDLRNFGDGVEAPDTLSAVAKAAPAPKKPASGAPPPLSAAAPAVTVAIDPNAQRLITSGDTLPDFQVEAFLSPVSVWTELANEGDDPMKAAFEALWKQAQTRGANAVVGMRWALTAEGKVLVTGTPVRGRKK